MKISTILISFTVSLINFPSFAQQELFIPRNITPAYEKGTRSYDGKPGSEYWQNSSDYEIDVLVDPYTYTINGSEEITYYNNSPDTLKRIVLRLYPNVFKKGSARDYSISPEGVTDGVKLSKVIVGSNEIDLENNSVFKIVNTNAIIYLSENIPPKSSINIKVEWSFKILPKSRLRMGIYDSTTIFVGYWYPQIAVYDDIDGWDYNNYGGQEEFYNDFSSFDVNITLPNNFSVWATGELQNPEVVLSNEIYEKFLQAQQSDTVIRIITSSDINSPSLFNEDKNKNTWIFRAKNVTDFAFAISDQYLWDGLGVILDNSDNEKIFVQAIYPSDSPDFHQVAEISKNLINYFSNTMPGIGFPFPSFIAFNNGRTGGGMEFPMMINDGSYDIYEYTVSLTAHEMAHQYFPFLVGTNEKKYAFMDEGWAVMLPFKYMDYLVGVNTRLVRDVSSYESVAGTEDDIPAMIPSFSQTYTAYRHSAYNRSSIAYEILRDMLGDEIFLKALREYINRWKRKHPIPYDFFYTFNEISEQNLNWFWKPWFFEIGYPDLKIDKVHIMDGKVFIDIQNNGTIPVPVKLTVTYEDDINEIFYYKADTWKTSNVIFSAEIILSGILKEIKLGDINIPDSDRENNLWLVH